MALHEKHDPGGTFPTASRSLPAAARPARPGDAPVPGPIDRANEPSGEFTDGPEPTPEERETVRRAAKGDRDAFRQLVEDHTERVFRIAMKVLRCDRMAAEDIAQEVFLRAFRGLSTFDGAVKFGIWLHTIATNVCISEYRKRRTLKRNRLTLSMDAPIAGTDDLRIEAESAERDPSERAEHAEFSVAVREAMAQVPDEFRDAVVLRDLQGLSYEEISEILGVPAGTVRSRIHRGRLALQQLLQEYME